MTTSTVRNHSDDVLSDVFVGDDEFSLLRGGDIHVLYYCLVREVLVDGDGAVFKVISIGKYPCVTRV